jgi:hypothetical protein
VYEESVMNGATGSNHVSLVYGDYSNTQALGTTVLNMKYDPDFSVVSNATLLKYKPATFAEAMSLIQDQEIFSYTIPTGSTNSNYSFTLHDYTFTETTTVGNKTFETSFIHILQSILG